MDAAGQRPLELEITKTHGIARCSQPRTGVAHSALAQEQSSGRATEGHETGVANAERQKATRSPISYSRTHGSPFPCSYGPNTTTTYLFGVGPPGLEGPVRRPSSNPLGSGLRVARRRVQSPSHRRGAQVGGAGVGDGDAD